MDLPRAVLAMQHVTADKIDDDVAYVRVPALGAGVAAELRDKLQQFQQKGVHKLVLDLRDCASGPMSEGIAAAQLFVPSGPVAVLSGQTVTRQEFPAVADKVVWRDPLEVLISDGTSGAAEVAAAALGNNHRADLGGPAHLRLRIRAKVDSARRWRRARADRRLLLHARRQAHHRRWCARHRGSRAAARPR